MIDTLNRPDGRPEAYRLPGSQRFNGLRWTCVSCPKGVRHFWHEIVLASPVDASDGQPHFVCVQHTPDDIVIFDPETGWCRDKAGKRWKE